MELALVKLYQVTGKELYLDMAEKFLEIRGKTYVPNGEGVMSPTYAQQHALLKISLRLLAMPCGPHTFTLQWPTSQV